ncbi:hypothetical protein [Flavihumibacter profundi]|jgi:hypothetical protein|uniref:hypothetical protein n=1 Tax=Flavihumibacter profundi TaxID=2716883 RepID=UPI001CC3F84E|nr:hypothetical protein [Flavihumibacter profundi]MBZ5856607.1 hypothetical protein [Flavihumibacter profundi]
MNTRIILTLSAILLAVVGISLSFLPEEISHFLVVDNSPIFHLLLQITGALFFAFAMLNWMAKGSIIGGIYNRPLAVANFTHFAIGSLALLKAVLRHHDLPSAIWAITFGYCLLAVLFARILFRSPAIEKNANT